jgi:hypothetical protein
MNPLIAGGTTSNNMQFGTSSFPYSGGVDGFVGKYSSSGCKTKNNLCWNKCLRSSIFCSNRFAEQYLYHGANQR